MTDRQEISCKPVIEHGCRWTARAWVRLLTVAAVVWAFGVAGIDAQERSTEVGVVSRSLEDARRVALVVGNARYTYAESLKNPENDARAVANALEDLDFEVTLVIDASLENMDVEIAQFGRTLDSGTVALYYYAGHGMQVDGHNYLVPVDANISVEEEVRSQSFETQRVLDEMANGNAALRIMILDACRNNPYVGRGWRGAGGTRGLASIAASGPTLVAFSTAVNDVAADGDGNHSPYTEELIRHIRDPLPVGTMFERVQNAVFEKTNQRQAPFVNSGPMRGFSLAVDDVSSTNTLGTGGPSGSVPATESRGAGDADLATAANDSTATIDVVEPPASAGRDVLTALYDATNGARWSVSTGLWLTREPLDEWYGVTTDADGYVTSIDLRGMRLSGAMPAELGSLPRLKHLDLADNRLSGSIPPELGQLRHLTELNLMDNRLSGAIPPELGNLTELTFLDLDGNELSGPIPPEFANLAKLTELWLAGNRLTGSIPAWIGDINGLTKIGLDSNRLSGEIPAELSSLKRLERLYASENELSGSIPRAIGELGSLERLGLMGNNLTGAIPAELGGLVNLRRLELSDNHLTGVIPPHLGALTSLEFLNLSHNDLEELIPPQLSSMAQLRVLNVSYNRLTGPVPSLLGNLSALSELSLESNDLDGPIPAELGQLTALSLLNLKDNALSGAIPPELANLKDLRELMLRDNRLTGPIPLELGNLENISVLQIGDGEGLCVPRQLNEWYEQYGRGDVRAEPCHP